MPHFVWSKINGTTARRRSGRTPPPLTKGFRLNRYTRRLRMPHSCLRRLLRLPSQLLLLLMQPIASSCRCRHAAAAPRNRWPMSLHVASQQMSLVTITRMCPPTLPLLPPMPPFFSAAAALHIAYRTITGQAFDAIAAGCKKRERE